MASTLTALVLLAFLTVLACVNCNSVTQFRMSFSVLEEVPSTYSVANLVSELRRRNREVTSCNTLNEYFQVSARGDLQPTRRIDRESICSQQSNNAISSSTRLTDSNPACTVTLSVICLSNDTSVNVVRVSVTLVDVNDNAPGWSDQRYEATLAESVSGQTPQAVRVPLARDADTGRNALVQYTLGGPDRALFHLSVRPDAIYLQLRSTVDREQKDTLRVLIDAHDLGTPTLNSTLEVLVNVLDVNDHAPQFLDAPYRIAVAENVPVGTVLAVLSATDGDSGPNGLVSYRFSELADAAARQLFQVDESTGQVSLVQRLDFESARSHQLHVVATDGGAIPLSCESTLTVEVTDVNDNPVAVTFTPSNYVMELRRREGSPCDSQSNLCVEENARPGTWLATVFAEDRDAGDNERISCRSETQQFALNPLYPGSTREFNLTVAQPLDREASEKHVAIVACTDNSQPALSSTLTVFVDVLDVNDNAPRFEHSFYNVSVAEKNARGLELLQLKASDPDAYENARITYMLHPNDSAVRRLVDLDERGRVLAVASFDRETTVSFRFRVLATDAGHPDRLSATATVQVSISDVNDVAPKFDRAEYIFQVEENTVACIGQVHASDEDAEPRRYGPISYRLATPSGVHGNEQLLNDFSVDAATGRICTRKQFDRETQSEYRFGVLAVDNPVDMSEPQLTAAVSVRVVVTDVNDNAPQFIFPTDQRHTVNVSFFAPVRYRVARVEAVDRDAGENASIMYSMRQTNFDNEKEPLFIIESHTGDILLNRPFHTLQRSDPSGATLLHRTYKLYVFAKDGGPKSRESSQSLDVIVDMSTGQLQEESDTPRNAAVLNHPVVLVSVLVLLALVFLVLLVVVLSCAFNRNCYAKRSRDRRRPKEIVSINPDQERYLLPPAYHDPAQQLAVHCISSPLSRSIISHNQNVEVLSDASSPGDTSEQETVYAAESVKYESVPKSRTQHAMNTSPSFSTIRRVKAADLLRQCNGAPRSCPTSPPPETHESECNIKKHQASCDSEVRAFTPRATGASASGLRTLYQPSVVNLAEERLRRHAGNMHTFPRGFAHTHVWSASARDRDRIPPRGLSPIRDRRECDLEHDSSATRSRESLWNDSNNNSNNNSGSNEQQPQAAAAASADGCTDSQLQSLTRHLKLTKASITDEISAI